MPPSTDNTTAESAAFAAAVLRKLLQRIDRQASTEHPCRISHAWTDGRVIHLVYTAPPSSRNWGLARDTTRSLIDPGPWQNADEAALYYFLLDVEENQPWSSPDVDDLERIHWFGDPLDDLPQTIADLPHEHRHQPTPSNPRPAQRTQNEPRRYGNPPVEPAPNHASGSRTRDKPQP